MHNGFQVLEHRVIAEKALGKPLPIKAQIHHIDGNPNNNDRSNLVICPDEAYHRLLHRRSDAVAACGHADWIKCSICGRWDDKANMYQKRLGGYHNECRRLHRRNINLIK